MNAYRRSADLPIHRRARVLGGRIIRRFRPVLAAQVGEGPFSQDWGPVAKLLRNAHLADLIDRKDHEAIHRFHQAFWASPQARSFYTSFAGRFEDVFLAHHAGIVEVISEVVQAWSDPLPRLVEIGSGDGRLLEYLSEHLPDVAEFHGVELNAEQVARCQARLQGRPRLAFHHNDSRTWLEQHSRSGTVLLTNGGVGEYSTRGQLLALLERLRASGGPCAVAFTETIATDHCLDTERESIPYGRELAFSHHYPAIAEEAGFQVVYWKDRPTREGEENHPTRWVQLVAVAGADGGPPPPQEIV